MTLFDDALRCDNRPKRENEPVFEYYNTSGRPAVSTIRELLETWFQRFPDLAKNDLRARFRSSIDSQHKAAFFELYLHELLRCMGFEVGVHPQVNQDVETHPDFIVSSGGAHHFYAEATLALPSRDEAAEEARIAQVYDTLNTMDSPNFCLLIRLRGAPATPPPGARLRAKLSEWLADLDPDELADQVQSAGFDNLPSFEWSHDDWHLSFLPLPRPPESRGRPGVRPVGIIMPGFKWVGVHEDIKAAVDGKASKYGDLDLPLVVAVNVMNDFCEDIAIMEGLFGQETVVFGPGAVESGGRLPNGAWMGRAGPRNRRVSAALIAPQLELWSVGAVTPELYHNPWALRPLPSELWPLPQRVPSLQNGRVDHRPGATAPPVLGLADPWLPSD